MNKDELVSFGGFVTACLIVVLFLVLSSCVHCNTGEKVYTGYIYSATTEWGKPVGHIRFSEMAGEDSQPSFCVKDEDRQKLAELTGSGKKVRVTEPAGFKFVLPWHCAHPAEVEVVEER